MKEIYRHREISTVALRQQVLEQEGIPTLLRNEFLDAGGYIAVVDEYPNLCVMNDEDYERAYEILKAME